MSSITTIIFTGTNGTRMRPLALDKSKTILPFMGKPLLLHTVTALKSSGLTELIFTSSGRNGEIKEYFSDGAELGVHIDYYDGVWRETAGTAKDLVGAMGAKMSDPLLVLYGDSLIKTDYQQMVQFHAENQSHCTILYHRPNFESFIYEYHDERLEDRGPRTGFGVMDLDSRKRVTAYIEKALVADITSRFTNPVANAGVFLLGRHLLDFVPDCGDFDFSRDLLPRLLEEGVFCHGFDIEDGYRLDVGTIRNYYTAQLAILEAKLDFDIDFPLVGERIWVGNGSSVTSLDGLAPPTLICENSTIETGAHIECSIIGNNVRVGKSARISRSILLDDVTVGSKVMISDSIIGEGATIRDGVVIPANTALGSYCCLGESQHTMKDADFAGLVRQCQHSGNHNRNKR